MDVMKGNYTADDMTGKVKWMNEWELDFSQYQQSISTILRINMFDCMYVMYIVCMCIVYIIIP